MEVSGFSQVRGELYSSPRRVGELMRLMENKVFKKVTKIIFENKVLQESY